VVAVEVSLGAVVVSLLKEGSELLALTTHCFYAALDFFLLGAEPLLELHFVAFAVAKAAGCVAVGFSLFCLAGGAGAHV
jgi:hypothetical protein